MKKLLITLILAAAMLPFASQGQTPGLIYKTAGTGKVVLDPNGDGYTSASNAGFITSDQTESEIPYKPISIPNTEPNSDLSTGPSCSFGDIVDSGVEDPVFSYLDANQNLLFRFRLGGTANNTKGYSILIDADQKFGMTGATADPNAVAGNPGFEFEIVLRTNFGVSLYNIDGTTSGVLKTTLSYDNYAQKSIALSTSCGDADYFYDFYMPFSVITSYFPGVTTSTPLRMVAVTSSNATSAIGNNAVSDVSGVNDAAYGYSLENMFSSVINNFYPTPANAINGGFPMDLTACPLINNNLNVNSTLISGTSAEANGTTIKVYKNNSLLGSTTVSAGVWSLSVSGLASADVITATATASGKSESFSNCSPVTVAASCSQEVVINASNTNTKNIGGTGVPGAIIKVYQNGVLISASPAASATVDGTGAFCWKTNGNTGACNGGAGTLSGSYKVTQTVSGQCESKGVYVCVGTTTQTTAPVITTTSLLSTSTSVSGTSVSGARVILFADGVEIGSITADAVSPFAWTISGLTLSSGQVITAKAISGTNCISNASNSKTVLSVSSAPVIYGTYCTLSAVTSISGSSSEAAGTTIEVFANGSSVGTTTTSSGGAWTKSGLSLTAGTVVTAKATASGKTTSAASNVVTIGVLTSNSGLSVSSPITEGTSSISGSLSGSGTVKVYIDGTLLGTAVVSGSTWSLTGLTSLDVYAGGKVTAAITSGANCESAMSASVTVSCLTPDTSITFTASASALCAGATTSITLASTQSGVVYQLYQGSTSSSIAVLGTGSALTLTSSALLASTTLSVKAIKISPVSCFATLSQQLAVTVTDNISTNTLTAPATTVFCSAGDAASISGSTPTGGNGSFTYQWQQSSDNISYTDINGATLKDFDPAVVTSSTYYRRMVTSGSCSVTSAAVLITINTTNLTNSIVAPAAINLCPQQDPDLISGALPTGGSGSYTYQWQSSTDNNTFVDISGATSQDYNPDAFIQNTYVRRLVSSGGCNNYPSNVIKFSVVSAATSSISTSANSLIANGSSTATITLQMKDASGTSMQGNCLPVLSATSGTLSAFTSLGNGSYTAEYTAATTAGTATITATLNGILLDHSATITLTPGAVDASQSTITSAFAAIAADGASSTMITVQLKDAHGNNVNTGGSVVNLLTTLGTISSVTNNGDGTYTATLTASTVTGMAVISGTVDGDSFTSTTSVNFIVTNANAAQSTISSSAVTLIADGVSIATITVQLKDINGNNLTSGGSSVVLATSAGTLSAIVDNLDGTYSAVFTAATSVGTADITGILNGTAMTSHVSIQLVSGTASAVKSTISASAASLVANGTSSTTVTVQLKDANDNVLTSGGSVVALSSTLGTLSSVTDNLDGTYTATLTSATTAGVATITGTLEGNAITDDASVQLIPGAADAITSTVVASSTSIVANGISTTTITIQLKDAFGNSLTSGGDALVFQTTSGSLSTVVDNGDGTYTVTLTSSITAGQAEISGTLNGVALTNGASVQFIAGPASVSTSMLSVSATYITADGLSTALLTVQLKDANGNILTAGGETVTVLTSLGSFSTVTDNQDGTYTATLTSATETGTALLSGKLNGVDIVDTKSIVFTAGATDVTKSVISVSSASIIANGTSTVNVTVQLRDANGNMITSGGNVVALSSTLGALSSVTDNQDGTYAALFTSGTVTGTSIVTGTLDGNAIEDDASVQLIPGAADAITSTVVASSTSIVANGISTTTITIQLKDVNGNNLVSGGDALAFQTTSGTLSSVVDNGDGTYTITLTSSTTTGQAVISGTVNGVELENEVTVQFIAGPASVDTSELTVSSTSVTADGTSTVIVTVQLKDAYGNLLTTGGDAITVSASFGSASSVIDNQDGTYSLTLTSATQTGIALITAKINDVDMPDTKSVAFTPGAADAAYSEISISSSSIIADGISTVVVTVQLKDANGNKLVQGNNNVMLTTTLGVLTSVIDNGDGTYTATLTSSVNTGVATITGTIQNVAITSSPVVQFLAGPASADASTINVSSSSINADGVSTVVVTIQVKDQNGNLISAGGELIELATSLGALSAIVDNNDGTYTATITAGTIAGTATITGKINGSSMTNSAEVQLIGVVVNVSASKSVISASLHSVVANGASTTIITVQLKDTNGNNITQGGDNVQLTTTLGTLSAVIDNGNGSYSATLTGTTNVGTAVVNGKVNDQSIGNTVSVEFIPGVANATQSTISVSANAIFADYLSFVGITVQLKDEFGNNLTTNGNTVTINTSLGSITTVYYIGNGKYYAKLLSNNTVGVATLRASVNGVAMSNVITVNFYDPTVYVTTISATRSEMPADGVSTSVITVTVKNLMNDLVTDAIVAVETTAGNVSAVENLGGGNYAATLTAPATVQSAHINFSVNGARQAGYLIIAFTEVPVEAFFIPEGFSPDGDGVNDTFVIYNAPTSTVSLKIFDRWGNLIYENMNYENEWNGFANRGVMLGERLPDGTYFYSVDLNDGNKPLVRYLTLRRTK